MNDSLTRPRQEGETLERWLSVGGILAAVAAASCCVVPFVLFTLGISGAWISNLTALAPYQPFFLVAAASLIGVGLWRAYRRPAIKTQCADGSWCERPASSLVERVLLWVGAALVVLATAFPYLARLLLPS